jgi:ribonuclease BN (tRNA processing enzyme)
MHPLEIVILGSASGKPEPDRAHAGIALVRGEDVWLLDAGEGVTSSLLRCHIEPRRIRGVFITHLHPDHCVGVFMLIQHLHMEAWTGELSIHLPGGAIETFRSFAHQLYLVPGEINPRYQFKPLEKRHHLDDDLLLEIYPTSHLRKWENTDMPELEVRSFAFRVQSEGGSLFYSGDIGSLDDIRAFLKEKDLLILESAHIDYNDVLQSVVQKGIEKMILTHYASGMLNDLEALKIRARTFDLVVIPAYDGLKSSVEG